MSATPRGRPRAFDPDTALGAATKVFLREGYDGASMEALTRAMGINKPSLYATFGDKRALFLRVLDAYGAAAHAFMARALRQGETPEACATGFLEGALAVYAPKGEEALGCLCATSAATAAGADPEIRARLNAFFAASERLAAEILAERFSERLPGAAAAALARQLNGAAHSLAVRARTGAPREALDRFIEETVAVIAAQCSAKT